MENTGRIHIVEEPLRRLVVLCDDDVSVGRSIFMNMIDGVVKARHDFNGAGQVTILNA